jgi:ribosomal protein S18 acetylase RimI-like enzyme
MTDLSLRRATTADVPRLTELVYAAYSHYIERIGGPPGPMTVDYADIVRTHHVTVAEQKGDLVGLVVLELTDHELVINNVAVDPAYQGRGLGRTLLQHAEDRAQAAGLDSIQLYTHVLMTENVALYSRSGYLAYDPGPAGNRRLVYMRKQLA